MGNEKTVGALDLSEAIRVGSQAEIAGYAVPEIGPGEMGDFIEVRVMEGAEERSLFQEGTASLVSYSEDWVPGVGEPSDREQDGGWVRLYLKYEGIEEVTDPVRFAVRGKVSPVAGITKVRLRVKDSGGDGNGLETALEETAQYLFKKAPEPEVCNFITASADAPDVPCTLFYRGEGIHFSWEGAGGYYRVYRGDRSRLAYEGTGTSFEYPYGIQENTSFILEASFTDNGREGGREPFGRQDGMGTGGKQGGVHYCYQALMLTVDAPRKQTGMSGVQDKSGLNFFFCQYASKEVEYYAYRAGDAAARRGRLECQSDNFLILKFFQADRLPDGRVIAFSANGTRLCYQIQEKLGEPAFGKMEAVELGDPRGYHDNPVTIAAICTGCSRQGLHIAIDYLDWSGEKRHVYTGLWTNGGEALTRLCEITNMCNATIGINVTDTSAQLYVACGEDGKIQIYDLFYPGNYSEYQYEGPYPQSSMFECFQDGMENGLSSLFCKRIVKLKLNSTNKTYTLVTVKDDSNYFGVGSSSLGWFYVVCQDDVLKYALDKGTEEYSFTAIDFMSAGACGVKYQTGLPLIGQYLETEDLGLTQGLYYCNEAGDRWNCCNLRKGIFGGGR